MHSKRSLPSWRDTLDYIKSRLSALANEQDDEPRVRVEYTLMDGQHTEAWMTPLAAAQEAVAGPQNGVTVASLRVHWGDVPDEYTRSV